MDISHFFASMRFPLLTIISGLSLAACGGSSDNAADVEQPTATSGTFGLFITDKPSDDFAEINLDVVQAVLIGGDESQQVLFDTEAGDDPREVDLLDLTNFNQPIVFGEVAIGTYTKLRLYIDNLVLVPHETDAGPGEPISIENLPANGKIDLLDQDGFNVLPGATLLAEVDIDANKSIKVTGAGKSGKYMFRPVVKVQFSNDGAQDKLTRIQGFVSDPLDPAGSFALCAAVGGDNCVDVTTGIDTSFFDIDGLPTDFTGVALESPVVVIGRYQVDPDLVFEAIVVEIGGTASQVKGEVVTDPLNEPFLLLAEDSSDLTVDLQDNTKYFSAAGEVGADAVVLGADVEIEGVLPDPDQIRAALVFVEAPDDEQLSGTINSDITDRTFELLLGDASTTVSVTVLSDADILLVDETASEVIIGDISMLANGQSVELFGTSPGDGLFDANEVIVDVTPAP
jgi:hypothetical protein